MSKLKRLQIFLDHDVIIRHFLYSNAFSELEKHYDVQYVFPIYEKRVTVDVDSLGLNSIVTIPVNNSRQAKLRTLSKVQTFVAARRKKTYKFVTDTWKVLYRKERTLFRDFYSWMWVMSLPGIFQIYRNKTIKDAAGYPQMEKVIDDFSPDIIIHPSVLDGVFIYDLTVLSQKKHIPFIVLMNSWDNTSSRALIPSPPDYLGAWGEQTKQHAIDFLGMRPNQIQIIGAPQFDVYRQPPSKSRKEICQLIQISEDKKLILYAGSSLTIHEIENLKILDATIETGALRNCHVIYRPHPWRVLKEEQGNFYSINWKHVSLDPFMKAYYHSPKSFEGCKVHLTNYMDTHNILSAIDLFICNATTMILEAVLHNKPVVCIITADEIKDKPLLRVILDSIYYKEFLEKLNIPRCRNIQDLFELCRNLLNQNSSKRHHKYTSANIDFFVDPQKDAYRDKLLHYVNRVMKDNNL